MLAKIIMIVLMFAIIVIVHEWGHFIAARKNGVKVNEFAIGMGPKLWSKQKGETLYSIRALPIGGFCSMEGEAGEAKGPGSMLSKSPFQRFVIFAAGAFMNFILAWVLLTAFIGYLGTPTTQIESVSEGSAFEQAGIVPGETILEVNNEQVSTLEGFKEQTADPSVTYTLTIEDAQGAVREAKVQPQKQEDGTYLFGFTPSRTHTAVLGYIKDGFIATFKVVEQVFMSVIQLVTGSLGMENLAGIVGVVQVTSDVWDQAIEYSVADAIMQMVYIAAVLSANLAVFNLLPIPALDGGRILFTLIEMIRRKPVDPEKEGMVHFVGFVLLMVLVVVVLYNDIMRSIG